MENKYVWPVAIILSVDLMLVQSCATPSPQVTPTIQRKKIVSSYSIQCGSPNNDGKQVPSGLYFYKIQVGDQAKTKMMVFLQ